MPSNMVSQGSENSALPLPATTPLLAVSAIPQSALFPIANWRPRDGRGETFTKWWRNVLQLLHAFDVTEEQLNDEPPAMPSVAEEPIVTRSEEERRRTSPAIADQ